MARLRALKRDEDIAAIPTSEPVLVELEPPPTGREPEPQAKEPAQQQAKEPDTSGDEIDPAVKSLQEQLEAAKQAEKIANERLAAAERDRQEAIRIATERSEFATRSIAERDQTERDLINSALQSAQSELEAAKAASTAAFNAGDGASFTEAQAKVARASSKIVALEGAAADLSQRAADAHDNLERKAIESRNRPPDPPPQLSVAQAIDQNPNLFPKEKAWLKEHPELISDTAQNQELGVGFQRAVRQGLTRGTDAYFQFLDEFMGYAKPAKKQQDDDNNSEQQGNSIVSAPVSRQAQSMSGGQRITSNQVYLSAEQREVARSMGISDKAYALQVQRLEQAKKDDPEKFGRRA